MRWLNTAGVAERLGTSPRQVRERLALRPGFPVAMRPGGTGHPRWRVDEIDAWAEEQRTRGGRRCPPRSRDSRSSDSEDLDDL